MHSSIIRKRIALVLFAMVLIHGVVLWQEWWAIPIGFPDFSIFYTAGKIVAEGRGTQLYDDEVQESVQRSFAAQGVQKRRTILPFNHPPFEAAFFAPFTVLSFLNAYFVWLFVNLGILLVLGWTLRKHLPILRETPLWLWMLACLAFSPIFIALMQGQDSILLLLCYGMTWIALRRHRDFSAGAWLGLGLCKYHLLLPFLVVFLLQKRTKVVAGFLAVALILGVIGLAAVGWQGVLSYPRYVRSAEQTLKYGWNAEHRNTPNLRGFFVTILPGGDSRFAQGLIIATSLALLALSGYAWLAASSSNQAARQFAFALNLLMTLLVSFHAYVQDVSLLFLALLLILDALIERPAIPNWTRRALLLCSAILVCSPIYLVLILRFSYLQALTPVLLALFAAIYAAIVSLRHAHSLSTEVAISAAP